MYKGGYSKLIRPLLYLVDLFLISLLAYFFLTKEIIDLIFFIFSWIALSVFFSFYEVYRFTKIVKVVSLLFRQITFLGLVIFTYFYIRESDIRPKNVFIFFTILLVVLNVWRIFLHVIFKKYRIITGSNYKRVVIIGSNESTKRLEQFFKNEPGYGYRYVGFFADNEEDNKLGKIENSYDFIIDKEIDEIYCSVKELSNKEIKEFIEFCDVNVKVLKFIPDNKELYGKNLHFNYYDLIPVLSLRKIPFGGRNK